MNSPIRTRKSPALIEDTGITWSVQCARVAKTVAVAAVFSALAACGMQSNEPSVSDLAAFKEMSIPVWNSKEDCDAAANATNQSLTVANIAKSGDPVELNFSCDTVDTTSIAKADVPSSSTVPINAGEPTSTASAAAAPVHSGGGGGNPMMWYMLGNMMNNRNSVASSSSFMPPAASAGPAPSAFINSPGNGKLTMSAAQQFATPSPAQYAGLKTNGGIAKTSIIGSNVTRAASYRAATSSIGAKSSAHSSMGHSSGGHGGGGGGG